MFEQHISRLHRPSISPPIHFLNLSDPLEQIGPGKRVCVTGGRDWQDEDFVWTNLDIFHDRHRIVELGAGCATGVDAMALGWAKARGIDYWKFYADWDRHGDAAGHIRNGEMLDEFRPDVLLVFPGGTGTTNCAKQARKREIKREFFIVSDNPFDEAKRWG